MLKYVFESEKGLSAIAWLTQIIPKLNKKKYVVEIKEFRNKRSLRANAYAWELIDKLAEKLKTEPTDIYRRLIRSIGGVSTVVSAYDIASDRLMRNWTEKGLGWQAETLGTHDGMRDIVLYYGSSTYDTAQMSRLIDLLVQECEQQDIETLTPAELELMKGAWQCGA